MRRLLAMEKTNGIWTQKMLMKLDRGMVNIMDHEKKEIYNNILIYIVGPRPEESPTPSEMHIFQCVNVRSRDVVEDLKHFMNGVRKAAHHRGGSAGEGGHHPAGPGGRNAGNGGGRGHSPDFPEIKMADLSPYEGSL